MGAGRTVLVTGVSRDLGRTFARSLAADPGVDRVIGVDVIPPRGDLGDVTFVRADIRTPVIAKVIAKEDVDTVVHMSVIATPGSAGGRGTMKELNVIGTMQLLAACQKSEQVRRLVVKSSTIAYGASSRDPAMFTEEMQPRRPARTGYAKDVIEVEGYVRGFGRRRPDVQVALLRCANVIGPRIVSPLTSYLRLPVIPTVLGFDPRMQFLHESDLYRVLQHAVLSDVAGTFNVAGDGPLMLSQTLRRMGRPSVPVPGIAFGGLGAALKSARLADLSPELVAFLTYGRGVDTTRMRTVLGFEPRMSTAEALHEFVETLPPAPRRSERVLAALADRLPAVDAGGEVPASERRSPRLSVAGGDSG
ncbi:NAD-dependent epimerase/dehydratase family protein [Nocardioides sp. zg-ZUI104]|uniref:NAD-dependent epimerase/dehydratase family protein n=1 Tax=Nocardioides faecalis TaxID=2803858 RepID=UPI001BCAC901|nr:NAD-dependent epimerase/dehydratase family protein [Nocardioides faecalis]MBS4752020.1 NAD-dependent epimerase/dehydratase family protein [Nocardioides faecalis]